MSDALPLLVRAATPGDAATAIAVLRDSIVHLCVMDHRNEEATLERWLRNKTVDVFARWLSDPDTSVIVAVIADEIVGVGAVRRTGDLNLCYVAPGHERKGIGRALVHSLEAQARSWQLSELRLISTATARDFYERHGFQYRGESSTPAFGLLRDYHYVKPL